MDSTKKLWSNIDWGLLLLRIGVGGIFIFSGYMKLADAPMNVGFFASVGYGAAYAYLVAFAELLGGLAVLLGVLTQVAAGILSVVMVVAVLLTHKDIAMFMTPLALFLSTIALTISGGGRFCLVRKY